MVGCRRDGQIPKEIAGGSKSAGSSLKILLNLLTFFNSLIADDGYGALEAFVAWRAFITHAPVGNGGGERMMSSR